MIKNLIRICGFAAVILTHTDGRAVVLPEVPNDAGGEDRREDMKPIDRQTTVDIAWAVASEAETDFRSALNEDDGLAADGTVVGLKSPMGIARLLSRLHITGRAADTAEEIGAVGHPSDIQIEAALKLPGGLAANRAALSAAALSTNPRVVLLARGLKDALDGYTSPDGGVSLYHALVCAQIRIKSDIWYLRSLVLGSKSNTKVEDFADLRVAYSLAVAVDLAKATLRTSMFWTNHGPQSAAWESALEWLIREENLASARSSL